MNERELKLWIIKFTRQTVELNHLLAQFSNENGFAPNVYIYKGVPELVGDNRVFVEVSIYSNPTISDWEEIHIDYCRTFPRKNAFMKVWMPIQVFVRVKISMWWQINIKARFWNSRFRHWLGLKHPTDNDC